MFVRQLFDAESSTYTYLVADREAGVAVLIDPVREQVDRDLELVKQLGLRLTHVLETHVHADHITGAGELRARTGATACASAAGAPCVNRALRDGDVVELGKVTLTALATPGHTDDGISYVAPGMVFTGDTLLVRGCGRADFQNGDPGALYDSISEKLFALPDDTLVYPGHDYKGHTVTTIGEEKRWNARIAGRSRDAFIALMRALDLPPPRKLDEAVPANRSCGVGATLYDTARATRWAYRELSPRQLHEAEHRPLIIDVREPREYATGHIPGSQLVPLGNVGAALHEWNRDDEIVVVCRSGARSGRVAEALVSAGFCRVMNLAGGMLAHAAARLPLEGNAQ